MKITTSQLRRIIREEVTRSSKLRGRLHSNRLQEAHHPALSAVNAEQTIIDILDFLDSDEANSTVGTGGEQLTHPRAYGAELELEKLMQTLEDEGYTRDDLLSIDTRMKYYVPDYSDPEL